VSAFRPDRRRLLLAAALCGCAPLLARARAISRLDRAQSRLFRLWLLSIVDAQLRQGPTPRWRHRDCAGLVRFSAAEALRRHDASWKHAMGLVGAVLPPELDIDEAQRESLRHRWQRTDGSVASYVGALELVQENSRFISREWQQALPGDLFFFDQGDDQHLMLWMGRRIAYHTGSEQPGDSGLRAVDIKELLEWKDTRWQPDKFNPNFAGIYRFSFLSDA
jgi:uncharacterized protein YfaT (DUF1175 family)